MARNALGLEFDSAAQLSKRPGSVWNCLWGNALKRSPGIIRKSRVSYPVPGFLSSATWPSLPKKHYNGLNQTKPNIISEQLKSITVFNLITAPALIKAPPPPDFLFIFTHYRPLDDLFPDFLLYFHLLWPT